MAAVLGSTALLALGSAQAQTPAGTIAAGTDTFPSGGRITVTVDALGVTDTVELSSEGFPDAVVKRGPLDTKTMTIPTEIVQMELGGKSPTLGEIRIQVGQGYGLQRTLGAITNVKLDEKGNFSGDSFFDVFAAMSDITYNVHGRNVVPLHMKAKTKIFTLPPNKPVPLLPLPRRLEHFKCYQVAAKTKFSPKTVSLDDQFETEKVKIVKPLNLCAPVEKNRKKLADPLTHLKCYAIQELARKEKLTRRKVLVDNQFGAEPMAVGQARSLCAPSLKAIVSEAEPASGAAPPKKLPQFAVDYYKCYDVAPIGPGFRARTVALEDQFEKERAKLVKPLSLCTPVKKNGEKLVSPDAHLTCFAIQDVSREPKPGGRVVTVENQFGKEIVKVLKPQTLCAPSRKNALPPCVEYAESSVSGFEFISEGGETVARVTEALHVPYQHASRGPCP